MNCYVVRSASDLSSAVPSAFHSLVHDDDELFEEMVAMSAKRSLNQLEDEFDALFEKVFNGDCSCILDSIDMQMNPATYNRVLLAAFDYLATEFEMSLQDVVRSGDLNALLLFAQASMVREDLFQIYLHAYNSAWDSVHCAAAKSLDAPAVPSFACNDDGLLNLCDVCAF